MRSLTRGLFKQAGSNRLTCDLVVMERFIDLHQNFIGGIFELHCGVLLFQLTTSH